LSKLNPSGTNLSTDDVVEIDNVNNIRYYNLCNSSLCDGFEDTRKLGILLSSGSNSMKEFYAYTYTKPKSKDSVPTKDKLRLSKNDETIASYKKAIANNLARIESFKTRITNETPSYSLKRYPMTILS